MKRYTFNIMQDFGGNRDDQNIWVVANSKEEAINKVKREYHSIVDIMLTKVSDYDE